MKRYICVIAVLMSVLTVNAEQKARYDDQVSKIEARYAMDCKDIGDKYAKALDKLKDQAKKKGDLQGAIALAKEADRFKGDRSIPETSDADVNVKRAQAYAHKLVAKADADKSKRMAIVLTIRLKQLNSLKKQLVMAEKFEEALPVDAEIKSAEFELAEALAKAPKAKEPKAKPKTASKGELPESMKKGLVLWYGFDRDEKDKVIDKSGKGAHGKAYGVKWVADGRGIGNGVMEFDARSDMISIDKSDMAIPWAISCWVRRERSSYTSAVLVDGDSVSIRTEQHRGTRMLGFTRARVADWRFNAAAPEGEWSFVSFVALKDGMQLYIDGNAVQKHVKTAEGPLSSVGSKSNAMHGRLDDLMVWNRALSEKEVKKLYILQVKS